MNTLLLLIIMLCGFIQNIFAKEFTKRCADKGVYFLSFVTSFFALLFFVATNKEWKFSLSVLPFAVGFAVAYLAATVFPVLAIGCGKLSLSSLITSLSLLLPSLYGIIFLKEPFGPAVVLGLLTLVISLVFVSIKKGETEKTTFKWVIFITLAFIGNGMCSVVQKMQQVAFSGAMKNQFMIIALIFVALITGVFTIIFERKEIKQSLKPGLIFGSVRGIAGGVVNLLVMVLSNRMPASIMFPLISAGGIIFTTTASLLLYKEKITKYQFLGVVFGIVAVILLNI